MTIPVAAPQRNSMTASGNRKDERATGHPQPLAHRLEQRRERGERRSRRERHRLRRKRRTREQLQRHAAEDGAPPDRAPAKQYATVMLDDERDVHDERARRRDPELRADRNREREHAERRKHEDRAHEHERRVLHALDDAQEHRAPARRPRGRAPMPNRSEKTMSGSIAPSDAAFTGFAGTRSTIHCPMPGQVFAPSIAAPADCAAFARRLAAAAGSTWIIARIGGPASSATTIATASSAMNTRSPSRRRVPRWRDRTAPPTATTRLETTSGMTVMRMAETQSVPTGSMTGTRCASGADPLDHDAESDREPGDEPHQHFQRERHGQEATGGTCRSHEQPEAGSPFVAYLHHAPG